MQQLSTEEFLRRWNCPPSGQRGLITRTIFRGRGYSGGKYRTKLERGTFGFYHYGTCILEIDLLGQRIISYDGWSNSDSQAIGGALRQLGFNEHYVRTDSERPPRGLTIWNGENPLKKVDGAPYTLVDLDPDMIDWLKRRRKGVLLAKAVEGYTWYRWAYRMLHGAIKTNQGRLTNEPPIEPGSFKRARQCGRGWRRWDFKQALLTDCFSAHTGRGRVTKSMRWKYLKRFLFGTSTVIVS